MTGILLDIRFGLRQLAAKPGFTTAAILTLALGIGANTAVFSVLNNYLLKPLPYPHSEQLREVHSLFPGFHNMTMGGTVPMYLDIKEHAHAFSSVALAGGAAFNLTLNGRSRYLHGTEATASYFDVLGVKPLLGHVYTAADERPGRGQVAVISYRLWKSVFGGNRDVIGRSIKLDGKVYQVQAVMPPDFSYDGSTDVWIPLTISPAHKVRQPLMGMNWMIGRLKPGVGDQALESQLKITQSHMLEIAPAKGLKRYGFKLSAVPLQHRTPSEKAAELLLLQGAVLLVLLIACINVANLLLSRILGRGHELAMRSALGASGGMLARQLLAEGLCLAIPGGAVGVGLGWLCLKLVSVASVGGDGLADIALDWRVGVFALGMVVITGGVVSILPIFHLRKTDLQSPLQEGGHTASGGPGARRVRGALAVAELTLATALLAGAGLLLHSFIKLEQVDTGFNANNVLTAQINAPSETLLPGANPNSDDYGKHLQQARASFRQELLRRVRAMPAVEYAGIGRWTPFGGHAMSPNFYRRSHPNEPLVQAQLNWITPGYLKSLGIPLLKGRAFTASDIQNAEFVAIVGERFAERYFDDDAIGKQIALETTATKKQWARIIGIVPQVKLQELDDPTPKLQVYYETQAWQSSQQLVVRTSIEPQMLIEPLRDVVADVNPLVALYHIHTMRQLIAGSLSTRQAVMLLLIAFGGIALALAVVGVYGVLSYAARQRVAECGIRLAMGALPEDLLWLVIKDGLKLLAVGLVVGLGLAVVFGYALSSRLFGIAPYDPLTLVCTVIVLGVITLVACYLPARRAAKIDPAVAMMEQ